MISFCLKTHPGLRVEIPTTLNITTNSSNTSGSYYDNNGTIIEPTQIPTPSTLSSSTPAATTTTTSRPMLHRSSRFSTASNNWLALSSSSKGPRLIDNWQETYGQPHEAFFYVELVCNVWFIIELTVRFVVSAIVLGIR